MDGVVEAVIGRHPTVQRRALLIFDALLCVFILWALLAPTGGTSDLGPTAGYREPDLEARVAASRYASKEVGLVPRPWSTDKPSKSQQQQQKRKKKKQQQRGKWKKKKQQKQQKEEEEEDDEGNGSDDVAAASFGTSGQNSSGSGSGSSSSCGGALRNVACPAAPTRVVVTLSIGKRTHFQVTRLPMAAYAKRVGAELHVVDSLDHPCLSAWNSTREFPPRLAPTTALVLTLASRWCSPQPLLLTSSPTREASPHPARLASHSPCWPPTRRLPPLTTRHPPPASLAVRSGANSHFMKLPTLQYFLQRYSQLLFLDDDVLVSPHAPDVFAATPCASVGAVVEGYHRQGWHAMHARSFCSIYGLEASHPATCSKSAVKNARTLCAAGLKPADWPRALLLAPCSLLLAPCFLLLASCSLLLAPCFLLLAPCLPPALCSLWSLL